MVFPAIAGRVAGAALLRSGTVVGSNALTSLANKAKGLGGTYPMTFSVTNLNEIVREIKKIDERYVTEFRAKAREIAQPVQRGIKAELNKFSRANPPLSGMRQVHFGRVAWGTDYAPAGSPRPKPYNSALIEVPRRTKSRKYKATPIVRVVVGSPGTVLADMAGKSNKYTRAYQYTRVYDYMYTIRGVKTPGRRQHRITTQGLEMISNMPGRKPSRYVWKGAEPAIPKARKEIVKQIRVMNRRIDIELRRLK